MYDFIFLDLDDTLLDFGAAERAAYSRALREEGIEPTEARLLRYHEINDLWWERLERGETTRERLLVARHEDFLRELGLERAAEGLEERYRRWLGVGHYFIDGALDCLDYLKHRGCRLFLVSNGVADTQASRLKSAGIAPYFEDIFISETTGFHKPEAAYFDYCFARIPGVAKERALIVGDSLSSDVLGGKNAGIASCWFNRWGKSAPPELRPDYEIRSLAELQSVL